MGRVTAILERAKQYTRLGYDRGTALELALDEVSTTPANKAWARRRWAGAA